MGKFGKFSQQLWNIERPELDNIAYRKGFKKNPYPPGSAPPLNYASKRGLMELFDIVENKKPVKGNVSRYRKANEHTRPFPPARKPGTTKTMSKAYDYPLPIPKSKRSSSKRVVDPGLDPGSTKQSKARYNRAKNGAPATKRALTDAQLAKRIMGSNLKPGTKLRKR